MATTAHMLMLLFLPSFSLVLGKQEGTQEGMQEGFISIDCGSKDNYTDEKTGIRYDPDSSYIHTGENHNISENLQKSANNQQLQDLRSFSEGKRNCYTLKPVSKGITYILRAFFLHGNYDEEKDLPTFHLYVGTNLWSVVQVTNASETYWYEIMVFATGNTISVCLLNVDNGRPFISALELRPTNMTVSITANLSSSVSISTIARIDFGAPEGSLIRYPTDKRDLIWVPFTSPNWSRLSTSSPIAPAFANTPEKVMQTAVFPTIGSSLDFSWPLNVRNGTSDFYLTFHMADLLQHNQNESRIVSVSVNGKNPFPYSTEFNIIYLGYAILGTYDPIQLPYFQCSIYKTKESTLPPTINALEINAAYSWTAKTTNDGDVDAIMDIKAAFNIGKNWMGDPCIPPDLLWDGLNCSYNVDPIRIVSFSNGLTGEIPSSIFNLSELKYLDLSTNNLTGTIERLASNFRNTKLYLNCSGLESSVYPFTQSCPSILQSDDQQKDKGGNLKIVIPVIASVALAVAGGLLLCYLIIPKWRGSRSHGAHPRSHKKEYPKTQIPSSYCREFTDLELSKMTNDYSERIGIGGFGEVYLGLLEDGTSVAVKRLSRLSPPGIKQFLAEINILKTVHHRNLVPFVGYCKDEDRLALVYQYMPQGSLSDHLSGKFGAATFLSWGKRLQLACEAAQGLEYLHVGCEQCIVHRDVKASNILLSEQMEAKIADFGLSKVFPRDGLLFASTTIMGTPGYLDPEYSSTGVLTAKSDVYSFGVVLLELITGLPCIIQTMGRCSIVQHVQELLQMGNIGSIVDGKLLGAYELNSAWKAVEIAMECVATATVDRPTMSDVVVKLRNCYLSATHNSNHDFEDGQYRQETPQHKQSSMLMPSAR